MTTLFDDEDVIPDDLGWGVCVASAAGGGSFQVFAEKMKEMQMISCV